MRGRRQTESYEPYLLPYVAELWDTRHMADEASHGNARQQLAVGDRRRVAIGKAAFSTLWAAIAFFGFTVPAKQAKPVYEHAPWLNDPYDTLYSFAMFLVPLATCACRKPVPPG